MILGRLVVGGFGVNCYIIGCEETRKGMVIDPGDQAEEILDQIKKMGLDIGLVVNTHTHMDHIMAVGDVVEATGARYAVHEAEVSNIQGRGGMAGMFGASAKEMPSPDLILKGDELLEIGTLAFRVLHTPGHSQGGICLEGHGVIFTGDTLFSLSIGRTDFPGGDYTQLLESIKTKILVLPDEVEVFPGHGPESTIATEKRRNPFLTGRYQPPA